MTKRSSSNTSDEIDLREYRFTECRTFGHAWTLAELNRENGAVALTLSCARCGTHRIDQASSRTGALYGRRYDHPDGYTGVGRHSRNEYRQTLVETIAVSTSKRRTA
jgi:hypothetical protein